MIARLVLSFLILFSQSVQAQSVDRLVVDTKSVGAWTGVLVGLNKISTDRLAVDTQYWEIVCRLVDSVCESRSQFGFSDLWASFIPIRSHGKKILLRAATDDPRGFSWKMTLEQRAESGKSRSWSLGKAAGPPALESLVVAENSAFMVVPSELGDKQLIGMSMKSGKMDKVPLSSIGDFPSEAVPEKIGSIGSSFWLVGAARSKDGRETAWITVIDPDHLRQNKVWRFPTNSFETRSLNYSIDDVFYAQGRLWVAGRRYSVQQTERSNLADTSGSVWVVAVDVAAGGEVKELQIPWRSSTPILDLRSIRWAQGADDPILCVETEEGAGNKLACFPVDISQQESGVRQLSLGFSRVQGVYSDPGGRIWLILFSKAVTEIVVWKK